MSKKNSVNWRLVFGPDSAIVKHIKAMGEENCQWKLRDDKLVIEFIRDDNAAYTPASDGYKRSLLESRSQSTAEDSLKWLSFALRMLAGDVIPRYLKLALADAFDRIVEEGNSAKFLYGKQERRGRPNKDILEEFEAFQFVEEIHSQGEPYSPSATRDGAYYIVATLLSQLGDRSISEDEVRRLRRNVKTKVTNDYQHFNELLNFLALKDYKILQK
jgi:hypothetical protein